MAKIKFVGDIHFGKRPSHSSKASAFRHKKKVDGAIGRALGTPHDVCVQLGDLFDSYTANNNDMARAASVSREFDFMLMGNHDFSHNSFNVSALEDLADISGAPIVVAPCTHTVEGRNYSLELHLVPYMPTQAEFLTELDKLKPVPGSVNILALHTNMYGEGFNAAEVENNLTKEKALELTSRFDLVVSGHEHNGAVKHGVHMVGSVYPHNFGDISSKYVLIFDTETREVTKEPIWDARVGYASVTPEEFLELDTYTHLDFIEILGSVASTDILSLVKHMTLLLNESSVSSIKNNVKLLRNQEAAKEDLKTRDWLSLVKGQLTEEQFELFEELNNER